MTITKQYLQDHIHLSDELIARRLGTTRGYISYKRRSYDIPKPMDRFRHHWTEEERSYVFDNLDMPDELIGFAIERSNDAIRNFKQLNIDYKIT